MRRDPNKIVAANRHVDGRSQRILVSAIGGFVAAVMLFSAQAMTATPALADSVAPFQSPYTVIFYTEPGAFTGVDVSIPDLVTETNCFMGGGLNTLGKPKEPGEKDRDFATFDVDYKSGLGNGRIGPLPNGRWGVTVQCEGLTRNSSGGYTPLGAVPGAGYLTDPKGVTIILDGNPIPRRQPLGQVPELPPFELDPLLEGPPSYVDIDSNFANNVSPSCSDGINATYDRYNIAGGVLDNALALLDKRGSEGTAHQICALAADNPEEAIRAFCRAGKAFIPADWAYAAIARLGQTIGQNDIERFGQSARDSWAKQCEGYLF